MTFLVYSSIENQQLIGKQANETNENDNRALNGDGLGLDGCQAGGDGSDFKACCKWYCKHRETISGRVCCIPSSLFGCLFTGMGYEHLQEHSHLPECIQTAIDAFFDEFSQASLSSALPSQWAAGVTVFALVTYGHYTAEQAHQSELDPMKYPTDCDKVKKCDGIGSLCACTKIPGDWIGAQIGEKLSKTEEWKSFQIAMQIISIHNTDKWNDAKKEEQAMKEAMAAAITKIGSKMAKEAVTGDLYAKVRNLWKEPKPEWLTEEFTPEREGFVVDYIIGLLKLERYRSTPAAQKSAQKLEGYGAIEAQQMI